MQELSEHSYRISFSLLLSTKGIQAHTSFLSGKLNYLSSWRLLRDRVGVFPQLCVEKNQKLTSPGREGESKPKKEFQHSEM